MLVVDGDDLGRVQPQVGRIGPQHATDVHVAQQRVEPLSFERLEILRPDPRLPAGLRDRLPPKEPRLPEGRTDPDSLHSLIVDIRPAEPPSGSWWASLRHVLGYSRGDG